MSSKFHILATCTIQSEFIVLRKNIKQKDQIVKGVHIFSARDLNCPILLRNGNFCPVQVASVLRLN